MTYSLDVNSVQYFDLSGGSAGLAMICGKVNLTNPTVSGPLNGPAIAAAIASAKPDIAPLCAGLINLLPGQSGAFNETSPTGVQCAIAYDPTPDAETMTTTVAATDVTIGFTLVGRKTA